MDDNTGRILDAQKGIFPNEGRDRLIGRVGVCSKNRVGLITAWKELPWGWSYVGVGLDDGTPWASRNPTMLTGPEVAEYAENKANPKP